MPTNTYVALETQTLTAPISGVAFKSIPQTYTDLRLVISANIASGTNYPYISFNNDYSALGSNTKIIGNGTSATSTRRSNDTVIYLNIPLPNNTNRTIWTIDIMSYSSTNVFKTVLWRHSDAANTVEAGVGLKQITAAISQIDISGFAGDWATGSTFSLYGIAAEGAAKATGGYVTSDSQYYYHTFLSTDTFTPLQSLTCDVLTIAGGGGGGDFYGAGGGAGGLLSSTSVSFPVKNYTVSIGGGGTGAATGTSARGSNGVNSTITATSFTTLTATGGGAGGGGAGGQESGNAGGSGGGGGGAGTAAGGAGNTPSTSPSQGNNGSNARNPGGGGGGGAGEAGIQASGCGGVGSSAFSSWGAATNTGENVSGTYYYAGGGGANDPRAYGGGGAPASNRGTANTGGGGGRQTNSQTGNGGSGIVIIRYAK